MMYLTPSEAGTRLFNRYDIDAELTIGDVMLASDELDMMAPFEADVDVANLPDALLDWVALKAYTIATDEAGPITSEGMGRSTTTYASPEHTQNGKRLQSLIAPYLKRTGTRV